MGRRRRYLFFQLGGQTSQAEVGTCGGERPPPLSVLPSVGRFDYKTFIVRSPSPPSIDVGVIVLPSCTKGYPPFSTLASLFPLASVLLPFTFSFLFTYSFVHLTRRGPFFTPFTRSTDVRPIARRPTMPPYAPVPQIPFPPTNPLP